MKNILITGASSGIGRSTALKFAKELKEQCQLILVARRQEKLESVKKEIESYSAKAEIIVSDLTKKNAVKEMMETAIKKVGKLDLVFANAGLGFVKKAYEITDAEVEKIIDLNVKSTILTAIIASRHMVEKKSGHIILTSSLAGLVTVPQWSVYCASKWAITGFADTLRTELAPHNVLVTSLHPGLVRNEFFDKNKANVDISHFDSVTSADVAKTVYKAAFTKQRKIYIPKSVRIYAKLYQLFQKTMEKVLAKAFKFN